MGRNTHTSIMRAVPWVAVLVLGVFSINQLAGRSAPEPKPAPEAADAGGNAKPAPAESTPAAVVSEAVHDELLSLREERDDLRAQVTSLRRTLVRERTRGEREAGVSAALAAQQAASQDQLAQLTQKLETAEGRIDELCRQDEPSLRVSIQERIKAFESAQGNAWIPAATNLLAHDEATSTLRENEKLRDTLCLMVKGLKAGADRNDLASTLLAIDFASVSQALGPQVVLTPHVVSALLHGTDEERDNVVSYTATHAASLADDVRNAIGAAVARIVTRPLKHAPPALAAAARTLGLVRPSTLPSDDLAALLGHDDRATRTGAAYALSRSQQDLTRAALRRPCLKMLASRDPDERMAATMLGERIFDDFDFDPNDAPARRAHRISKLEAQAGP